MLPRPADSDGPAALSDLSPLLAATAQWLTRAYPADGGALDRLGPDPALVA
ncbi:hypothetical protein ABZT03_19670 [Streptomyces sp. NPDC005574]|uniref:hypothetical protein n=1 Tax=Streptomyces sp. NPDC005574 TaxID=3156891 RepID=UPI0033ADA39E